MRIRTSPLATLVAIVYVLIMPRLSQQRLNEIVDVLDESFFTSAGFSIDAKGSYTALVVIELATDANVYIKLEAASNNRPANFTVNESPGEVYAIEETKIDSFSEFLVAVRNWTGRLRQQLLTVDTWGPQFSKFKEDIESELVDKFPDKDERFSDEELAEIHAKLASLNERLSALEAEDKLSRQDVMTGQAVVDDLERATAVMPKRAWYRVAAAKLFTFSQKAAGVAGQQLIVGGVKALMEGKVHIPHI